MKAYIISYFGSRNEPEKRLKRLQNHQRQIDWWLNFDPDLKIVIAAKDYDQNEYISNSRIEYIIEPNTGRRVNPSAGRNLLLDYFYQSRDRWGIFMDNDAILKHHPKWPHTHFNINNHIRQCPELYQDIALFMPHFDGVPGDGAFTSKFNGTDSRYTDIDWNKELCFDQMFISLKGTLFYYQNTGKKFYMDTEIFPVEDQEFALQLYLSGLHTYRLRNIMMYEYNSPSTWAEKKADRTPQHRVAFEDIAKKHNIPVPRVNWKRYIRNELGISMPKRLRVRYTSE